jgi:hypothetical protein
MAFIINNVKSSYSEFYVFLFFSLPLFPSCCRVVWLIRGSKVTFLNSDTWCLTSHTCFYTQMEPKYILNFTFFMWSSLSIYCSPYFLLVMTANGFLQTLTMSFFQLHFIYSLLLMKILMLMCVVYFLSIYYRLHMLWRIDLNYTLSFPIIWFLFSV